MEGEVQHPGSQTTAPGTVGRHVRVLTPSPGVTPCPGAQKARVQQKGQDTLAHRRVFPGAGLWAWMNHSNHDSITLTPTSNHVTEE